MYNTLQETLKLNFWESDLNERHKEGYEITQFFGGGFDLGFILHIMQAVKFCAGWNKNGGSDPYEICCGYMGGICAMRDGMSLCSQSTYELQKYLRISRLPWFSTIFQS